MALTFVDEHSSSTTDAHGVVEHIGGGLVTVMIGNAQDEWTFPASTVPAEVKVGDVLLLTRLEHGWMIVGIDPEAPTILWDDDLDAKLDKVREKRPSLFSRPPPATPPPPRRLRPSELRRQSLRGVGALH